jgi:D-glycero-alpha-D-manno-heptose 1-phosphate guanylyltransferase
MIVLAGGFGTRLRSEISDTPKPLAPVHGRPFIAFLLDKWVRDGFRDFYFSLHYRSDELIAFLEEYKRADNEQLDFHYVIESRPMGTGGAVLEVLSTSEKIANFLVVNADTWLSSSFRPLACSGGNLLGLIQLPKNDRYGLVEVSGDQVIAFREKTISKKPVFINSGVYKFERAAFEGIPLKSCSLESDLLPSLISSKKFRWLKIDGDFIDIGVPEDYQKCIKVFGN